MDLPLGVLYDTITQQLEINEEEKLPFWLIAFYNKEDSDQSVPTKAWKCIYS